MDSWKRRVLVYHAEGYAHSHSLPHDAGATCAPTHTHAAEECTVRACESADSAAALDRTTPSAVEAVQDGPRLSEGVGGVAVDAAASRAAAQPAADCAAVVHLRHPKTGAKTCYVVTGVAGGNATSLQELQWFKESLSSWFIDNSVCEDGSLYLSSPVDPLFLLLPVLEEARAGQAQSSHNRGNSKAGGSSRGSDEQSPGMFRSLDEILCVDGFPAYAVLRPFWEPHLALVCDIREVGGQAYHRLDDGRVCRWLRCKVEQTVAALARHGGPHMANLGNDGLTQYAAGMLSEYLRGGKWTDKLCDMLSLSPADLQAAPQLQPPATPAAAVQSDGPQSTPASATASATATGNKRNAPTTTPASSTKTAKRTAAAANTRKITSFFARPK